VTDRPVFADRELVELLGDKSDLLAIADAIASVGAPGSNGDGRGAQSGVVGSEHSSVGDGGRRILRRPVLALVASLFVVVVLAGPALAVSPRLRELVGLSSPPTGSHFLVARVTAVAIHYPAPRFAPPLATVTFTAGEAGEAPGTGIPDYSALFVSLVGTDEQGPLIKATGTHGHYRVTLRTPEGGIRDILVGGWLNSVKTPAANGEFWIPVINAYLPE
jgi:hypothetical protein